MIKITPLIFALLFLTSCGENQPKNNGLTPLPPRATDPSDAQLKTAMQQHLQSIGAPASTRYQYSRIDLNHDGLREGIAFIDGPYGYWCGEHGCAMKIFRAHRNGFTYMNSIQPIRSPIYVSTLESVGWRNIIARVSGRQMPAKNVMLKFNGRTYPKDPSRLPSYAVSLKQNPSHTRLFNTY